MFVSQIFSLAFFWAYSTSMQCHVTRKNEITWFNLDIHFLFHFESSFFSFSYEHYVFFFFIYFLFWEVFIILPITLLRRCCFVYCRFYGLAGSSISIVPNMLPLIAYPFTIYHCCSCFSMASNYGGMAMMAKVRVLQWMLQQCRIISVRKSIFGQVGN